MSKNLRSATGNVIHAAGENSVRTFGNQPACTPTGQTGSSSFCRYYETNAPVVTCKKCIKKVAAAAAEVVAPVKTVEVVEVAPVTVETITEVAETTEVDNTFSTIEVGHSFRMMGETYTRMEFPAHLSHLGTMYAKDAAKGFLSYWARRSDGVGTAVVAMGTLEVERV